jgi:hypothetical protein
MPPSVLQPSTSAILAKARAASPLFANMVMAEFFAQAHTRGSRTVLPRTDGQHLVYDSERPFGDRTVSVHARLEDAAAELLG